MSKHLVIIAGEESGDQHAAKLLASLQEHNPDLEVSGLGGAHLQALGMNCLMDLTQLAITGITGVLSHLFAIYQAFKLIKTHLLAHPPDLIILVDYPGFNLRMAAWIKKNLKCPILYYVSPQIWAWKAKRIETIRNTVSHMAVILPFEHEMYQKAGIPSTYVGHPLMTSLSQVPTQAHCRQHFNYTSTEKILALCPGSRNMELERILPIMIQALARLKHKRPELKLRIVIPVAKSLNFDHVMQACKNIPYPFDLISGQAQKVMQAADAVVVASGTASLEAAILQKPMCIVYKSSWFNYYLARRWMKVKYLGLANLLLDRMAIPELLQMDCEAGELAKMMENLLVSPEWQARFTKDLGQLSEILGNTSDVRLLNLAQSYLGN